MSETRILGAAITDSSIELIEAKAVEQIQNWSIPAHFVKPVQEVEISTRSDEISPISIDLIQKLKTENITTSNICISLPTKDIIFRSFMIPFMQPNEIENAVRFEAVKYIPFNLEELIYRTHAITITENKTKKLKIIFIAIKRATLKYYTDLFKNANFNIETIEPAPLSLIRILTTKKFIQSSEISAIIDHSTTEGKIIVLENGIPQFVREFQLSGAANEKDLSTGISPADRLVNEISISLDYYNRMNPYAEIKKIFYLTLEGQNDLPSSIAEHTDIPVKHIDISSLFAKTNIPSFDILYAYGSTLYQSTSLAADFFFTETKKARSAKKKKSSSTLKIDFKAIMPVMLVCAAILAGSYFFFTQKTAELQKQVSSLEQELGPSRDLSTDTIKTKNTLIQKRITDFKSIRLKSDAADYLKAIPDALKEGMWLEQIRINFKETPSPKQRAASIPSNGKTGSSDANIDITGYAYMEMNRQQFKLVNQFLRNLKSNTKLSESFKFIELDTVKTKEIDGFSTTFFRIICQ